PANQLQRLFAVVAAELFVGLKIAAHARPRGLPEYFAEIVVAELHEANAGGFAGGHAGNRRADADRDAARATTGAALDEIIRRHDHHHCRHWRRHPSAATASAQCRADREYARR